MGGGGVNPRPPVPAQELGPMERTAAQPPARGPGRRWLILWRRSASDGARMHPSKCRLLQPQSSGAQGRQ